MNLTPQIGFFEILLLLLVVLLFTSAKELPSLMHKLGSIFMRLKLLQYQISQEIAKFSKIAEEELNIEKKILEEKNKEDKLETKTKKKTNRKTSKAKNSQSKVTKELTKKKTKQKKQT